MMKFGFMIQEISKSKAAQMAFLELKIAKFLTDSLSVLMINQLPNKHFKIGSGNKIDL